MKNKKFNVKTRKVVFSKGPIHLVDCDVRMSDGRVLSRQIIEHPGAVVIIPEISRGKFLLIRQFRFAARSWLWEWPAGGIERGENLRVAAARELMEETGFFPRTMKKILTFYPTPGISSEEMHLFHATNLIPRKAQGDEDEDIEVAEFSMAEMRRMVDKRYIRDAKTLLGIYELKKLYGVK